jgi:hypothetical protein
MQATKKQNQDLPRGIQRPRWLGNDTRETEGKRGDCLKVLFEAEVAGLALLFDRR